MRLEHDSLGSLEVPNFAYYGIQTEREIGRLLISLI